ncbi:2-C-methyl-D-erythritol 2,4-cyclodiphosphate synthase [Bacillus sp. WP8]|uniref:2-C-methyl-D-erythritol 2,4-cyclodiphosphate synthase n=1 Tax=Bacillus sp. WP8 TaxID=756828 RepID=UPI0037C03629
MLPHSHPHLLLHTLPHPSLPPIPQPHIPTHFPHTHPQFNHPHSFKLFHHLSPLLKQKPYTLLNIHSTIIPQKPKIPPYIQPISQKIPQPLHPHLTHLNLKPTTTHKLPFTPTAERIASQATLLLQKN